MTRRGADVVVVGTSIDPHVGRVLALLPDELHIVRLDVDQFPKNQAVTLAVDDQGSSIDIDGSVVTSASHRPSVAWFRRLGKPGFVPNLSEKYVHFATAEANHVLEGLVSMIQPGRWINEYWGTRRASVKPLQYDLARQCGLRVPDALFSNSVVSVTDWVANRTQVVAKTISAPIVYDDNDERGFAFTHVLDDADLMNLSAVAVTPVQVQVLVEPAFEVRLMTLRDQHIAVRIDGDRESSNGVRDWRSERIETRYSWMEVPETVTSSVSRLLLGLGIDYAASDFVVDRDGEYHFLEANPHGAWLWLEDALDEGRFTTLVAGSLLHDIKS